MTIWRQVYLGKKLRFNDIIKVGPESSSTAVLTKTRDFSPCTHKIETILELERGAPPEINHDNLLALDLQPPGLFKPCSLVFWYGSPSCHFTS